MLRLGRLLVLALLVLGGCTQVSEILVPEDVVQAARGSLVDEAATLVSAEQGAFGAIGGEDVSPEIDASLVVWKLVFHEANVPPCPDNARCIRSGPGHTTVYLDARTLAPVTTAFTPDGG